MKRLHMEQQDILKLLRLSTIKIKQIIKLKKTISEGIINSKTIFNLSKKKKIEMPVCESVYRILYKNVKIKETIEKILSRDIKKEN